MGSSFKHAVEEINSAFARAYNNKDAAGCAATYAEDACVVYSDGRMMKGRKALMASLNDTFKTDSKLGEFEIIRELPDGGSETLSTARPGEYFGEIGPLFGLPRSATVRARTDGTLIGYTVKEFRQRLGAKGIHDLIEHRAISVE